MMDIFIFSERTTKILLHNPSVSALPSINGLYIPTLLRLMKVKGAYWLRFADSNLVLMLFGKGSFRSNDVSFRVVKIKKAGYRTNPFEFIPYPASAFAGGLVVI